MLTTFIGTYRDRAAICGSHPRKHVGKGGDGRVLKLGQGWMCFVLIFFFYFRAWGLARNHNKGCLSVSDWLRYLIGGNYWFTEIFIFAQTWVFGSRGAELWLKENVQNVRPRLG